MGEDYKTYPGGSAMGYDNMGPQRAPSEAQKAAEAWYRAQDSLSDAKTELGRAQEVVKMREDVELKARTALEAIMNPRVAHSTQSLPVPAVGIRHF